MWSLSQLQVAPWLCTPPNGRRTTSKTIPEQPRRKTRLALSGTNETGDADGHQVLSVKWAGS